MGTKSLVFEIVGVDRASATFERIGAAVTDTSGKMTKFQRAGQLAGKALAVGLAGVAFGAVEATKAAAEDQTSQAQLAKQLKNTTGATDEQISKTNEWIVAQATANGVAVDDLRPTLAKLATTTGDVGTAQRLTALAMNVAAGSGQSLSSVTKAIVGAENGRLTGLGKLGIATKTSTKDTEALKSAQIAAKSAQMSYTAAVKAHGATSAQASIAADRLKLAQQKVTDAQTKVKSSTISADDALGLLAEKYHGAAASAADTLAGKQRVLSVTFHELMVKIGAQLIPVMTQLAGVLLTVVGFIGQHTRAVGIAVGSVLALAAAIKVITMVTAAWNAVMDANPITLIIIALAALAVGLVYAYKHSETFRNIVNAAFAAIKAVALPVLHWLATNVPKVWEDISSKAKPILSAYAAYVKFVFDTVVAIAKTVVAGVIATVQDYEKFKNGVVAKVSDVVTFFKNLPGKITGALAALPGQLLTIGTNIVMGLVHGIENAAGAVMSAVQSLVNKIPAAIRKIMHISSPSGVTRDLGENIGDGLAIGIAARTSAAESAAKKMADKVKAQLSSLKDALASTSSSVFGNLTGSLFSASASAAVTDADGNVTTPAQTAGQNLVSSLQTTAGNLAGLKAAFKALKKQGWSPTLLAQLFAQGGADLILELGSNSDEASAALGALRTINKGYNSLGNMVGQDQYGDKIHKDENKLHGGGKGKSGRDEAPRYEVHNHFHTPTDPVGVGRETQKVLLAFKRANGGGSLGLA